jgi:hypothetical protein
MTSQFFDRSKFSSGSKKFLSHSNKKPSLTLAKETRTLLGKSEWKLVSLLSQPMLEKKPHELLAVGMRDEKASEGRVLLNVHREQQAFVDRVARFGHLIS